MANLIYDFLVNSKLSHSENLANDYSNVPEAELEDELCDYRDYVLQSSEEIMKELENTDRISVTIESFGNLPDDNLYKQLVMYVDKIIVDDPLFHHVWFEEDSYSKALNHLMQTKSQDGINRKRLCADMKYILSNSALVLCGILKFFPISLLHDKRKDIPIYYSENYFEDLIPSEYRKFFLEKVKVNNIVNNRINFSDPLVLGRNIFIKFDDVPINRCSGYVLMETKFEEVDRDKGHFSMLSHIPDELPSQSTFNNWVRQSVNKAAGKIYKETMDEVVFSKQFNSMYLTQSSFTSNLLSIPFHPMESISSDLANLVLNLDLPIIDNIALDTLLSIRTDDGQAFENFRISLQSKLKDLRLINDPIELEKNLENLKLELLEVEINSINKAFRTVTRSLGVDAVLLFGSLITSYFTGGLTMLGVAGALLKGSADYTKYLSEVKENNSYFLWKVKKGSGRI